MQSREKFITDYVVLEKNCTDDQLLPLVLERHEERFGQQPESVAADKGFLSGRGHLRGVGGTGRLPGRAATYTGLWRLDDGCMATMASWNRG